MNITWTSNHYDQKLFTNVFDELKNLRSDALQVEFTGNAFQNIGQSNGGVPPFAFGFIAALIILLIVFRTVAATVLPLASAVAALGAGLGLIGILTHAINVSNITPQLAELMVIGVGVDYALFIVTRHRRNLRRGMSVPDSIVASINTSGRAVLFAGIDRVHRDPRPDRARRQLLQRHGDRRRRGGRPDHGGLADVAAGTVVACSA